MNFTLAFLLAFWGSACLWAGIHYTVPVLAIVGVVCAVPGAVWTGVDLWRYFHD